jgi:hypothetical protein
MDFERWLIGALEVEYLYRSCVNGTWREGSLAEDPGGQVERALETGVLPQGPVGETGKMLVYQEL